MHLPRRAMRGAPERLTEDKGEAAPAQGLLPSDMVLPRYPLIRSVFLVLQNVGSCGVGPTPCSTCLPKIVLIRSSENTCA